MPIGGATLHLAHEAHLIGHVWRIFSVSDIPLVTSRELAR
jgi:hypothetical protein